MSWSSVLKGLLAACIVTHFSVSSVETYSCENKECRNGRCNSNPKTCKSSKGCFYNGQQFGKSTSSLENLIEKGCSNDVCTELAFSVTVGNNQTFRYDHQCCYSEMCNQTPKDVSPPSTQPNGVECPACLSDDEGVCNPVSLKCSGAETKCVEVNGTDVTGRGPPFGIRAMGCATETACNLKNVTILKDIKFDTFCSSGGLQLGSISSVLTSFFLMKALLWTLALP